MTPQLLAASILGVFVKHLFGGQAIYALALGVGSLVLAAAAPLLVDDAAGRRQRGAGGLACSACGALRRRL